MDLEKIKKRNKEISEMIDFNKDGKMLVDSLYPEIKEYIKEHQELILKVEKIKVILEESSGPCSHIFRELKEAIN